MSLSLNVIIPSVIMTKFSSTEYLGPFFGLVVALIFPLGYGFFDLIFRKKYNIYSIIGLISILLTGGIGLFQLSRNWMVAKETLVPFVFGVAISLSNYTRYPLVKTFLNEVLNIPKINDTCAQYGHEGLFEKKLKISSHLMAVTFFVSAILNYFLAIFILQGEPGTVEFNESLGKMTALSFPVITIPMTIMMGCIIFYLFHSIKKYTSLDIETFMKRQ